jgi:hypothetical protein
MSDPEPVVIVTSDPATHRYTVVVDAATMGDLRYAAEHVAQYAASATMRQRFTALYVRLYEQTEDAP